MSYDVSVHLSEARVVSEEWVVQGGCTEFGAKVEPPRGVVPNV